MKIGIIYQTLNKINGKSYIGQTICNFKKYKQSHINASLKGNSQKYFHRAILKYGPKNFKWKILFQGECHRNKINELEIFFIAYYNTFGKNGYNLTVGGDGGNLGGGKSTSLRLKNDLKLRKKFQKIGSENFKNAHKNGKIKYNNFKGKKHTKETKIKIGKKNSGYQQGSKNSQYDKMWIYNLELKQSKQIDKNDSIPDGWKKGRRMKF